MHPTLQHLRQKDAIATCHWVLSLNKHAVTRPELSITINMPKPCRFWKNEELRSRCVQVIPTPIPCMKANISQAY